MDPVVAIEVQLDVFVHQGLVPRATASNKVGPTVNSTRSADNDMASQITTGCLWVSKAGG